MFLSFLHRIVANLLIFEALTVSFLYLLGSRDEEESFPSSLPSLGGFHSSEPR